MSTLLSSLKLSTRPEKISENPTLKKREKLLTKLDQQLAMANALVNDEVYTAYRDKWQKNTETGQQEKIQIPKKISPWFYKRNNQYFFEVRYGNKPLELSKGNHAIEVGEQENLAKTIGTVIEAVVAGEVDSLLDKVTSHLSKKK
jgi:murein DD-endopeptidase MepM/ murein hydrolase activator NlpD